MISWILCLVGQAHLEYIFHSLRKPMESWCCPAERDLSLKLENICSSPCSVLNSLSTQGQTSHIIHYVSGLCVCCFFNDNLRHRRLDPHWDHVVVERERLSFLSLWKESIHSRKISSIGGRRPSGHYQYNFIPVQRSTVINYRLGCCHLSIHTVNLWMTRDLKPCIIWPNFSNLFDLI